MCNSREPLVGLLADPGPELAVGLLGILKAGAALVPLSPAQPDERLALIAADCGLELLVTERRYLERARRVAPCDVICLDEIDALPAIPKDVPEESLAYVIYTSGSTGLPKGVGVSHANMVPMLDWSRQYFGLDETRRVLQSLSYAFDFGLWEILTTLVSGGTFFVPGPEESGDPEAYARLVREWEIDTVHATPSFFQAVAQAVGGPLERLRTLHLGGEALSRGQVERFAEAVGQECRQYNGYGPTEVTVNSLIFEVGQRGSLRGGERVPIGRASAYNEVYVLDPWGQLAPVGVAGELWVGGPGVARGYLGRPDLTAEKFVPDPFSAVPGARIYRTGDLVRWLASGDIEFLGRIDGQVKVRGFRIELGEVESVLRRHPGVQEAVVVARPDRAGSLALVGYVLGEVPAEELRAFLRQRLPEAMVPAVFMALESLPLTSSGKVDRRALPEPSWGSSPSEGVAQAPRTPVEELLAGIWSEVLGLERVGLEESFFELGGHSLLATRLMSRVRQSFGVELPLRRLFEVSTVAGLAAEIETLLRNERQAGAPPLVRGAEEGEYPLSFAQERLWVLDRFEPGNPAYNMPAAVRLRGGLDVSALERGLSALVDRHESLRTVFAVRDGQAVQVVTEPGPLSLPLTDLTALPGPERQGETERLASEEALRPFDLARGPLLRTRLIRTGEGEHVLLLNLHHIVSDGWSLDVLVRELAAFYAALREGRAASSQILPELPVRYADYAAWQRRWLSGPARETQLAYWREQLAGAPQSIELPTDYPRPAVRTHGCGHVSRHVSGPVAEALLALGRREGASLFMVLLAAFKVLLHRLAGEEDIVIGSPIAGRGHRELEGLIGMFLNTLVLRTSLVGDPTIRELLARVRETALDAYAHQDVPFEMLLDELKPERDLSRTPLFQVFFNMLNLAAGPAAEIRLPDLTLEGLPAPDLPSKFDLTLYVQPMAAGTEGIRFDMAYNGDLFEPQRIAEMLEQLASLLARFGEDPEARIGSFSLLTPGAVAVLPDPRAPLGEEWWGPVHERLTLHASREPGRLALRDRNGAWTYGELEARSNRLAHELVAAGLRPEEPVAIYAQRSATLVWAVLGTLKAGGAFVILDPAYPAARLIETLRIAAPRAFLRLTEAGRLPAELDSFLDSLPGCIRLDLGPAAPEERVLAGLASEPPAVAVGPDDLALIAFTSGSTGLPKGILGRHGPLSHFLPWQVETLGMEADDRFSLLSGLSHDPLQRDIFTPLWVGGSIHVPDPLDMGTPGRLAEWMRREGVSVAHLTPAMGQILTERPPGTPDVGETELPALRRVLLVGDVLTRRDVVRLRQLAPGVTVVNLYGSTETQRSVGYHVVPEDGAADRAGRSREILPLGQGMRDVQLLVLNKTGALAGIGEVGEICVRSPHLARGYLGDEALTRERFQVNPFTGRGADRIYRTGDLGRYLPDGSVTFVSRADQQVKIRGFRIEPGEIEARLGRLPGVREAIVLARGDSPGDKRLVAYVTPDPTAGKVPTMARMRSFLKEKLPAYMVPASFVVLDRLPVTPNGKVDRKALLQIDDRHRETDVDYKAPQTEAELIIASILQEVLKVDRIGVDDNFFDLGGNSLLLVQVHGRLQEQFGREILLVEIFNHPTVRALAAHLEGEKGAAVLSEPSSARTDQLRQGRDRLRRRLQQQKAGTR